MTDQHECFSSEEYVNECQGDLMASCVKCGILMARMYEDIGARSANTFWCGSCGIIVYKSVLGVWKTDNISKSRETFVTDGISKENES